MSFYLYSAILIQSTTGKENTMQLFNVLFKMSNSDKPLGVLWVAENEYIVTKTVIQKMQEMYKPPITFKHIQTTEVK